MIRCRCGEDRRLDHQFSARNLLSLASKKAGLNERRTKNMFTIITIDPQKINLKPRERTKTVRERPLFAKGRPHLIAVSKSVDAKRAVPPVLSHAGVDPAKTLFFEATAGARVV